MDTELKNLKNISGNRINFELLDNINEFYIANEDKLYILNKNYSVICIPNINKFNSIIQIKPDEFLILKKESHLKYILEHAKYTNNQKELKFFIEWISSSKSKKIPTTKLNENVFLFKDKDNKTVIYDTKNYRRFDFKNTKFVFYDDEHENIILEQSILFEKLTYNFLLQFDLESFTYCNKIFSKDEGIFFPMLKREDIEDMYKSFFKIDNNTLLDLTYIDFLESFTTNPSKKLSLKLNTKKLINK